LKKNEELFAGRVKIATGSRFNEVDKMKIKNALTVNEGGVTIKGPLGKESMHFQDFFDSIPIGCLVIDTKGIIEEVNRTMVAVISTNHDSLIGSSFYDHFPIQTSRRMKEGIEEVLRKGKDVHFRDYESQPYLSHTITLLDKRNDKRRRIAILTYHVTDKMIEKAFYETEERSRQLVELSPDTIIVHTEMKVVYINAAGVHLFSATTPEDLIGKHMLDLIHPEDREFVRMRIKQIDSEGTSTPLREYRITRFDGGIIDVEARGTLITYKGKPSNLVMIRDISARKAAERELKTLNEILRREQMHHKLLSKRLIDLLEKDHLEVATELHDQIGQLLTTLKIDMEMISSELKPADASVQQRIRSANKKVARVMIDLKKIAQRLMPSMIRHLGLVPALRALINDEKARTGIKIHFFTNIVSERFDSDKELALYRITKEALSNTIKHARAKQVFINLMKKDHVLLLGVEDDGIGFRTGMEVHISTKGGPLGLHIMRERVVQLGGELSIDSRVGEGTHVLAELPL